MKALLVRQVQTSDHAQIDCSDQKNLESSENKDSLLPKIQTLHTLEIIIIELKFSSYLSRSAACNFNMVKK